MEILLKVCAIKDTVGSRFGIVNNEFVLRRGGFSGSGFGLECKRKNPV